MYLADLTRMFRLAKRLIRLLLESQLVEHHVRSPVGISIKLRWQSGNFCVLVITHVLPSLLHNYVSYLQEH